MAIPQVIIAKFTGAELPALVGSLFSILITVWLTKRKTGAVEEVKMKVLADYKACSPFILVLFCLLACPLSTCE